MTIKRVELHFVSPNDRLSSQNGSAVLSVARALQEQATAYGNLSIIVGGMGKSEDLEMAYEGIGAPQANSFAYRLFDLFSKAVFSVPLARTFIKQLPDVSVTDIFCHNQPWIVSSVRAAFPSARVHLYVHNVILRRVPKVTIRRQLRKFDTVVCVSSFVRTELVRRARVDSGLGTQICAVYNGVDPKKFDIDAKLEFDVAYFGRIVPEKGVKEFANAVRIISETRNVSVALVGGRLFYPTELSQYEQEVLDILNRPAISLTRTGPVPPSEVPQLMNATKVVVVPSVWDEPCGLVCLEALASTAGLVASPVGGIVELEASGGVVFASPHDPKLLADSVRDLLDSPELLNLNSLNGRKWTEVHDWGFAYRKLREIC